MFIDCFRSRKHQLVFIRSTASNSSEKSKLKLCAKCEVQFYKYAERGGDGNSEVARKSKSFAEFLADIADNEPDYNEVKLTKNRCCRYPADKGKSGKICKFDMFKN